MKFGVIVCPNCRKAKGVDLSVKATKCTRCGKILKLERLKFFYETNSREKLQKAIGLVNADLNGKLKEFKEMLQNKH